MDGQSGRSNSRDPGLRDATMKERRFGAANTCDRGPSITLQQPLPLRSPDKFHTREHGGVVRDGVSPSHILLFLGIRKSSDSKRALGRDGRQLAHDKGH